MVPQPQIVRAPLPAFATSTRAHVRLSAGTPSASTYDDGLFAVAPMMDYTDRFLRYMLRRLSLHQTLYTEMVTANTIVHCPEKELERFLGHDGEREHPLVLQLGGADPDMLRRATEISVPWGFTALNLNCGCPSDRVAGSGRFGAALMSEPELVADCCAAMAAGAAGRVPITVKCRIGITRDRHTAAEVDDEETYASLAQFIDTVSSKGSVDHFVIHARKAVLGGLSPAQNRQIPPLRYNLVRRLAADFPDLRFALNGGLESIADAEAELRGSGAGGSGAGGSGAGGSGRIAGVMLGRAVCARPWEFATVDTRLYGASEDPAASRRQVLEEYCTFADEYEKSVPQKIRRLLLSPPLNLFANEPHGKTFRRVVDETANEHRDMAAADVLRIASEKALMPATLDAAPGWRWDYHEKAYVSPEDSLTKDADASARMTAVSN